MKNQVIILIASLLLVISTGLSAQTKSAAEVKKSEQEVAEKKAEIAKMKEDEKKRMVGIVTERGVAAEEIERAVEDARINYIRTSGNGSGWISLQDGEFGTYFGSQNSSTLEYSKRMMESTSTKEFSFEVEKDTKRASISVSGSCDEGEILIKIFLPGGKAYTEVLIDRYGSVNWSKSFTLEEEKDEKIGTWKFQVITKNATGTFRASVKSY